MKPVNRDGVALLRPYQKKLDMMYMYRHDVLKIAYIFAEIEKENYLDKKN